VGIRVQDLLDPKIFHEKIAAALAGKVELLERVYGQDVSGLEAECDEYLQMAETLRPYIADTSLLVWQAVRDGMRVLLEGAQGTLLDIDHGTYPYVTSSNPIAGGACTGGGIGPLQVDEVIGVAKAYSTRVGAGPFPTELEDAIGEGIATRGREVGTTTGRRRRVGWFDALPARFAVEINSVSSIMLNKIDILSGLEEVRVCVGYDIDGERVERWPASADALAQAIPIYETHRGWQASIHDARSLGDLPDEARLYVTRLEELLDVPIHLVSVGPERSQTIVRAVRPHPVARHRR
jgi:adenylosuccinate synthase